MTGNARKISYRNKSWVVTIPAALAADKRLDHGMIGEWRSFPGTEEEWRRIQREHPNALVLIPRASHKPAGKE
jgi:hypothetical protein